MFDGQLLVVVVMLFMVSWCQWSSDVEPFHDDDGQLVLMSPGITCQLVLMVIWVVN